MILQQFHNEYIYKGNKNFIGSIKIKFFEAMGDKCRENLVIHVGTLN